MKEKYRRGRPVIKTTIEFPRDTYTDIKKQAAKEGKSIKDWLSLAALEKLLLKTIEPEEKAELYKIGIRSNSTTKKVYEILDKYLPENIAAALLLDSCEKADIDYSILKAKDIPAIKPYILKALRYYDEWEADKVNSELEKLVT